MSANKPRTIPPLRVSQQLRADAESVLAPGETMSAFVSEIDDDRTVTVTAVRNQREEDYH